VNALKQFEDLIEGTIEGSLAEMTSGRLHPIEIAKKLARALDSGQTFGAGKTLAPNDYTVRLSSADYAAFASFRPSLERELASYLTNLAHERGLSFVGPARVTLVEHPSLRPRRVRVLAILSDAGQATQNTAAVSQATSRLPIEDVRSVLLRSAQIDLADGRSIVLDKPVISLGRSLENDVVLEEKSVSRRHAQLRFVHSAWCLYDLASANGTLVNDQAVQQVVLRDGDQISLGAARLTFRTGSREAKHGA
jgi:hypothetical protein